MVDVGGCHPLEHLVDVLEIQQVAGEVLYTVYLLPGLGLFIAEAEQLVIGAAQVRKDVEAECSCATCYQNTHVPVSTSI